MRYSNKNLPKKIASKDKWLSGSDIILNLKEIVIHNIDSYSSSNCSGSASFSFDDTKHGRFEDPHLTGTIRIIKTEKKNGCYILSIKYKPEN